MQSNEVEELEIPLLPVQKEFLKATEDFVVICSARSCGKSFVCVLLALLSMMDGQNVTYFIQNRDSWTQGPWLHCLTLLSKLKLNSRWKWNASSFTGTLQTPWGEAHLYVRTYENVEGARGGTEVSLLILDEFMLSDPTLLAAVGPTMRGRDLKGKKIHPRIRAVSTPKMNSPWQLMVIEHEKHGIRLLRAKMTDNVFITDEQRAMMAKGIFDEKLRRQEIEGEILTGDNSTAMVQVRDFSDTPQIAVGPVWAGLDMAHAGDRDKHVFCAIQGNVLLALHQFGVADGIEVAGWIRKFNAAYKIAGLNCDLAWSESVFDQLKFELPIVQIPFGGAAEDKAQYENVRAEMYFAGARKIRDDALYVYMESEWIDPSLVVELKRDMSNIHWIQAKKSNKLMIEPKDDIRIRIGHSPDTCDAYCLAAMQSRKLDPPMKNQQTADPKYQEDLEEIFGDDGD